MRKAVLSATCFLLRVGTRLSAMFAALVVASLLVPRTSHAQVTPHGFVDETVAGNRWLYPQAARAEVAKLRVTAEASWDRIASELDLPGPSDLSIRIGKNPDEMQTLAADVGPLPAYASGVALPDRGLIFLTLTAPDTWELVNTATVLAHEMSHVALHRAVRGHAVPRWFTEGVAIDHARERSLDRFRTLWEGTVSGTLMPLDELSRGFPAQHHGVSLAYAQSADFVRFLKRQPHGELRFSRLLESLAAGNSFSDSVLKVYRAPLPTLEREWIEQLHTRFGRWPLLLTGLAGLWLALTFLLVVAYVRARQRHHRTLTRWASEEALADRAIAHPPPLPSTPPQPQTRLAEPSGGLPDDVTGIPQEAAGVPTILYRGESHTLH